MCVIIAAPPNVNIPRDALLDAIFENPDGAGFMIAHGGHLWTERSANDPQSIVDAFLALQGNYPDAYGVFHARIATQGSCVDENTHPFQVPGKPWAMMHNGVMPLGDPFGNRSDSRILAEDHMSTRTWGQLRDGRKDLEKWLKSNKVVLLSSRREKGGRVIIWNENLGTWSKSGDDKGCWYSHRQSGRRTRQETKVTTTYSYGQGWRGWDDAVDMPVTRPKPVTADFCPRCQRWPKNCKCPNPTDPQARRLREAADMLNVDPDDIRKHCGYKQADIEEMVDEILGVPMADVTPEPEPEKDENGLPIVQGSWSQLDPDLYLADDGTVWRRSPNPKTPNTILPTGKVWTQTGADT